MLGILSAGVPFVYLCLFYRNWDKIKLMDKPERTAKIKEYLKFFFVGIFMAVKMMIVFYHIKP